MLQTPISVCVVTTESSRVKSLPQTPRSLSPTATVGQVADWLSVLEFESYAI